MATAYGYVLTLGFVSPLAGVVQRFLPALAAAHGTCCLQAAVVAACAVLVWLTDHHSTLQTLQAFTKLQPLGEGSPGNGLRG